MSSWKKASKTNQKTHKERHQPAARQHLGLLEKKKDYQLRAKDQNEKKKTLQLLHKKALNKNQDEFYHHMIKSKINDGEHHEEVEKDEHSKEQLELMQTQDLKYINMKRTMEANKIQRLQSELHMIDVANTVKNKHIFFVSDESELSEFNVAERLETHPSLIGRKTNRPHMKDLENISVPDISEEELNQINKKRTNAYQELNKRIDREKELTIIQQKLKLKQVLHQKRLIKPKKLKAGTKNAAPVYHFKYERKK